MPFDLFQAFRIQGGRKRDFSGQLCPRILVGGRKRDFSGQLCPRFPVGGEGICVGELGLPTQKNSEHLGFKRLKRRPVSPCVGGETGLEGEVHEHFFEAPSLFCGDLGKKHGFAKSFL